MATPLQRSAFPFTKADYVGMSLREWYAGLAMQGMIAAGHISNLLHLTMLRHGVMSASRLMYCTSTSMGEAEIDRAVTALNESLVELRPFVEKERPASLV